jgi:type II secretory pathway pseudopilin PulG
MRRMRRGSSLVEVLVALALIVVCFASSGALIGSSSRAARQQSDTLTARALLADLMEVLLEEPPARLRELDQGGRAPVLAEALARLAAGMPEHGARAFGAQIAALRLELAGRFAEDPATGLARLALVLKIEDRRELELRAVFRPRG